jgi:hypothetical protein
VWVGLVCTYIATVGTLVRTRRRERATLTLVVE